MGTGLKIFMGMIRWCNKHYYTIHDKVDGEWVCRKCATEW